MRDELIITIMSGVTLMTYQGVPSIGNVAKELQRKADYEGVPVAIFFEGVPLMALPNGDQKLLVDGYYKFLDSMCNQSEDASLGFFGSIVTGPTYSNKLPFYTGWVRSLLLPGEKA